LGPTIAIFFVAIVLFGCLPLLLPAGLGIFILIIFWKDKFNRIAGLLILKYLVTYPIFSITLKSDTTPNKQIIDFILSMTPGVILTLLVAYFFVNFVRANRFAQLIIFVDILYWLITCASSTAMQYVNFEFASLFILLISPSVYSVIILILITIRSKGRKPLGAT